MLPLRKQDAFAKSRRTIVPKRSKPLRLSVSVALTGGGLAGPPDGV
jgi:hypothetical protein